MLDVKKIRKQWSMTQEQFAYMLDVSVLTIRRWELGWTKPRERDLKKLKALKPPMIIKAK